MTRRPAMTVRLRRATRALDSHRLALGLLTFAVAALLATVAFRSTTGPPLQSSYRIKVALPNDAPIVRSGQAVRIGGKLAGLVTAVDPGAGGRGRIVTASITKGAFRPLPVDTKADVRVASLLYETYVELWPGTARADLRDGDSLRAPATSGTDLLEVVQLFDASTRAALRTTLTSSGIGVAGRGQQLNEALSTLPGLSRNLAAQLRALTAEPGALSRLVGGAAATTSGLRGSRPDDVAGLIGSGDSALAAVARRRDELGATLQSLPPFEDELLKTAPVAEPLLDDLAASARDLTPAVRSLNAQLPSLRHLFTLGDPLRRELRRIADVADPVLKTSKPIVISLFPIVTAFGPLDHSLRIIDAAVTPYTPEIALAGKRLPELMSPSAGGLRVGAPAVVATATIAPRRCYDALPDPGEADRQSCQR